MINNKHLTTLLIVIAVVNVLLAGIYFFAWNHIQKTTASFDEISLNVALEMDKDGAQHDLMSFISKSEKDREKLNQYFVSKDNFVTFLEGVEQLSADAAVEIIDSNLDISNEVLTLNYSIEGYFENIMYFTGLIERLPFNISIVLLNAEIKPGNNNAKNPLWKARLQAEVTSFIE